MAKETIMRGYRVLPGSAVPEMGSRTYDHTDGKEYTRRPMGPYADPGTGNSKPIQPVNTNEGGGPTQGSSSTSSRGLRADNSTAIGKVAPEPPRAVPTDVQLSAKHHRESIQFNEAHAQEHEAEAVKHRKALAKLMRR